MDYNSLPEIKDYYEIVRHGEYKSCVEQLAMCDFVEKVLSDKDVRIDTEQLGAYLKLEKYFPFDLFPWEKFIFTLRNCLYTADGFLRLPDILSLSGRGTGKTGYMAFEEFTNLTPASNVTDYEIDIFALSEKQSMTSFNDVYNMLEKRPNYFKKYFYWNKVYIKNRKTGNSLWYNTSSAQTKDGYRPGSLYFDEYHGYVDDSLIDVATTGLGKTPFPKKGIFTTDGKVRGGPLDTMKKRAEGILFNGEDDLGLLPFICRLPSIELVHDESNWHMANPSLRYFPNLMNELRKEYKVWCLDPSPTKDFIVKRMNIPGISEEESVTKWENIEATNKKMPDLTGCECVPGIDYSKTNDFVSAGLLFRHYGTYYWISHTWVCLQSEDLHRIKAPLDEWQAKGLLTMVDAPEIAPEMPVEWICEQLQKYRANYLGLDNFRITWLKKALDNSGLENDLKVLLTKNVTQMRWAPVICSEFANKNIVWGDNPLMRWFTNNACRLEDKKGNMTFGKKEAKSRKTDGFMALVHAFCASEKLTDIADSGSGIDDIEVISF